MNNNHSYMYGISMPTLKKIKAVDHLQNSQIMQISTQLIREICDHISCLNHQVNYSFQMKGVLVPRG